MNKGTENQDSGATRMQAGFDLLADEYFMQRKENTAITGESPEYFSEYKITDLAELLIRLRLPTSKILDFGSGIGNSLPYFRKYFSSSEISCADVSVRSIEIAQNRLPGQENQVQIAKTSHYTKRVRTWFSPLLCFIIFPTKSILHLPVKFRRIVKPSKLCPFTNPTL